jgi:hypothetical protein
MAKPTSQLRHTRDLIANREHDDDEQAKRVVVVSPTGSSGSNPSLVVSYNAAGEVVKLEKTIGSTTYTKTFTRSDNAVASTLPISVWS